jgi:hypothetical protein
MIDPDVGRFRLGTDLEVDLSDLPLDAPIPKDRLPKGANLRKAFFEGIMQIIREEKPTLRDHLGPRHHKQRQWEPRDKTSANLAARARGGGGPELAP